MRAAIKQLNFLTRLLSKDRLIFIIVADTQSITKFNNLICQKTISCLSDWQLLSKRVGVVKPSNNKNTKEFNKKSHELRCRGVCSEQIVSIGNSKIKQSMITAIFLSYSAIVTHLCQSNN